MPRKNHNFCVAFFTAGLYQPACIIKKQQTISLNNLLLSLCRHRPIFPGSCPPSIFSTDEFNCRVRDGNGWDLIVIGTGSCVQRSIRRVEPFVLRGSFVFSVRFTRFGFAPLPSGFPACILLCELIYHNFTDLAIEISQGNTLFMHRDGEFRTDCPVSEKP